MSQALSVAAKKAKRDEASEQETQIVLLKAEVAALKAQYAAEVADLKAQNATQQSEIVAHTGIFAAHVHRPCLSAHTDI